MMEYEDRFWSSNDGLQLHYRDYPGRDDRPPVICIPGLTRNARDFENLAERIAGDWRVICVELRGRGESEYAKDSATYNPMQYVEDITALLDHAGIERFISFGTSLGGLITMALGMVRPQCIAGVLLNDVGPVVEASGLERIKDYVGQGRSFPTWVHAARAIEETQRHANPGFELSDWVDMAKRVMTIGGNGRIAFDYDMKIAEPFADTDVTVQADLWPGFDSFAGKPALFVRGELSDILSAETLAEMARRMPEAEALTLQNVGHAPTLDEPEAVAAIGRLLAKIG